MSQRFFRCPRCLLPHHAEQPLCTPEEHRDPASSGALCLLRTPSVSAVSPRPPAPARPALVTPTPPRPGPPPLGERALLGKTIRGKYTICGVLGEGGMATVFEAIRQPFGARVALKILKPRHAQTRTFVERFHREARAAASITHPNVCDIHDVDTLEDGRPYLVMPRLVGETLADRVARCGGLPFDDVVDILVQTLSALAAAHERRIVHRDVKPENLFLARRAGCPPLVKMLDFGVSKTAGSGGGVADAELTGSGMVMGTPHYMSPEQASGDRRIDPRIDLYACGVILYEALTGQRPFLAADQLAILHAVLTGHPRRARDWRPSIPREFDAVLAKAMARRADDRYAKAAEFQRDLLAIRGSLVRWPPVDAGSQGRRTVDVSRHHPTFHSGKVAGSAASQIAFDDDAAPTRFMPRPWPALAAGVARPAPPCKDDRSTWPTVSCRARQEDGGGGRARDGTLGVKESSGSDRRAGL